MRAPWTKVFLARYVVLMEIMGYGIAAVLLVLWIAFFFIDIDEHCFASGTAVPATIELNSPQPAVLDEVLAEEGDWLDNEAPVFLLNRNPKAIAARQSHSDLASLGEQILTLADSDEEKGELETLLASTLRKVDEQSTGQKPETVTTPAGGLLHLATTATRTVVKGKLAEIVSNRLVRVNGTLGALNILRVKAGLKVKVKVIVTKDETYKNMMGTVIGRVGLTGVLVEAPVPVGPDHDPLADLLSRLIIDPDSVEDKPMAELRIVVGRVSLVKFLFKKQKPAAAKKKKKDKGKGKEQAEASAEAIAPPPVDDMAPTEVAIRGEKGYTESLVGNEESPMAGADTMGLIEEEKPAAEEEKQPAEEEKEQ